MSDKTARIMLRLLIGFCLGYALAILFRVAVHDLSRPSSAAPVAAHYATSVAFDTSFGELS